MSDATEQAYRAGVESWMAGDLALAQQLLEAALAGSAGPEHDPWWFAASRALAHVALDRGDLDLAAEHLAVVPLDLVGAAQTIVLQGKLAHRRGDDAAAGLLASAAVARVLADGETDVGSLMNGAIALANAAELLVELRFAAEAARVAEMGRERTRRAGVDDPSVASAFDDVDAGAARIGDPRTDPVPVERWVEAQMARNLAPYDESEHVGYAVVVGLAIDDDADRFDALDRAVCDLLDRRPELGEVDGTGTDGDTWELFVDGDDPEALWDAIRPLVEAARPSTGSRVVLQHMTGERREIPLGDT